MSHHNTILSQILRIVPRHEFERLSKQLDYQFYSELFGRLYQGCMLRTPKHDFGLKEKLFLLDASLIDVSMKLFPRASYNTMKAAFKLHIGLDMMV